MDMDDLQDRWEKGKMACRQTESPPKKTAKKLAEEWNVSDSDIYQHKILYKKFNDLDDLENELIERFGSVGDASWHKIVEDIL